jgi:hypothetical protein
MIVDKTNGFLLKAIMAGHRMQDDSLLEILQRYSDDSKGDFTLYPDFAPLSFLFALVKDGKLLMNGGVIFHGKHDGNGSGGPPSFSVSIDKAQGWRVHT